MKLAIKKITMKSVVGNVKVGLMNLLKEEKIFDGSKVELMMVSGIAHNYKIGEHPEFGNFIEFKGEFFASSSLDNKEYESGKCFLPDVAADLLSAKIDNNVMRNNGESKGTEFAISIIARIDLSMPTNYTYEAIELIESRENDPLAAIKAKAMEKRKSLGLQELQIGAIINAEYHEVNKDEKLIENNENKESKKKKDN